MSIKLTWTCDGEYESFNVYRSYSPIDKNNLPFPIAIKVTNTEYIDNDVDEEKEVYYVVGNKNKFSDTLLTEKITYDKLIKKLNPVAWYRMDDDLSLSSTHTLDSSVNQLHAQYRYSQNNIGISPGHSFSQIPLRKGSKGCMGFNATTGSIHTPQCVIPNNPLINTLNQNSFTILYWCKKTGSTTYNIMYNQTPDAGAGSLNAIREQYGQLQINPWNGQLMNSPSRPGNNITHFVCFVIDRINQTATSYTNDIKKNEIYNTTPPISYSVATHFPGYYNWNYYGYVGYISDLTFFNKALTDSQILELYNYGRLNE